MGMLIHELSSKSLAGTLARHTIGQSSAESQWPQHRTVGNCYWIPDPEEAGIRHVKPAFFDQILLNESMLPDHLLSRYESGLTSACKSLGLQPLLPPLQTAQGGALRLQ